MNEDQVNRLYAHLDGGHRVVVRPNDKNVAEIVCDCGMVIASFPQNNLSGSLKRRFQYQAKRQYHNGGEIEIDDNARLSMSEDGGCYVQAWVRVGKEGPA